MTEQPTTITAVVTDDEAAAINAARDALYAITERANDLAYNPPPRNEDDWREPRPQDYGRVVGIATVAHDILFDVLNHARSYCNAPLTDDQLHNRHDDDETEA